MKTFAAAILLTALMASAARAGDIPIGKRPGPEGDDNAAAGRPVVVVFDFVSAWDKGDMGRFVAKYVWAKLDRSKLCVLVERGDLVDVVKEADYVPAFDAKPAEIAKFTADKLAATHAIWGVVEQADTTGPASERRLRIRARALAVGNKADKLGVDLDMTVKNQREIQLATAELVRRFFELAKPDPDVGPDEEKRWRTAPNLVTNPGFEDGDAHPKGWEPFDKSYHHKSVSWGPTPGGRGRCIRFKLTKEIAATYGVAYYGDRIPIEDGEVYRVSIRVRSDGPTVKVFLKHYRFFPPGPNEKEGQWRETRRAPMNCYFDAKGEWQTFTRDFRPHRDDKHDPTVTRVELYAYHPAGTVWFDNVVLKKIKDRAKKQAGVNE